MTALTVVALVAGIVLLVVGAELLVRGAAAIASRFGIPPVVIGLTVVAFGTSAPELAVSVGAALSGSTDVAFGNVVGSNVSNVLLILGASALVGGLAVSQRVVRLDVPLVIGVSVLVLVMALDNSVGRVDGSLLFAGAVVYTWWLIRASRRETPDISAEYTESVDALEGQAATRPLGAQVGMAIAGLVALVVGARMLVAAATDVASAFGLSELVIGLTVVAVGTSLPELATSMLAAVRGQRDIAVGNIVGSNLLNLLCVLGASSILAPDGVPVSDASLRLDVPVMLAATAVLLPIFWSGFRIDRWEGAVMLGFYVTYMAYLLLDTSDHAAASVVGPAALIVTPLVMLGFGVSGYQGWRRHRSSTRSV